MYRLFVFGGLEANGKHTVPHRAMIVKHLLGKMLGSKNTLYRFFVFGGLEVNGKHTVPHRAIIVWSIFLEKCWDPRTHCTDYTFFEDLKQTETHCPTSSNNCQASSWKNVGIRRRFRSVIARSFLCSAGLERDGELSFFLGQKCPWTKRKILSHIEARQIARIVHLRE